MHQLKFSPAVILSLACAALTSCGSSNTPPPAVAPDVYIAGFHGYSAAYWKNGTEVDLTDGTSPSTAPGIAVSGSTVVAVGYSILTVNNQEFNQAYMWTNGAATTLNDNGLQTEALSVAFSGTDVYVSGYSFNYDVSPGIQYAVLWKNGVPTHLSANVEGAIGQQVIVNGSDIYVAGQKEVVTQTGPYSYNTANQALYWKNGAEVDLTNGQFESQTRGIAVSGSDVYVAGFQCLEFSPNCVLPYYWKNGTAVQLSNNYSQIATSISIANGNLWITSQLPNGQPIAYENGVEQDYLALALPTAPWQSVAYGDNFYTAGSATNSLNPSQSVALAWSNTTNLFYATTDTQDSAAFAIAVAAPPTN